MDRIDEIKREMSEGQQPEGIPATEIVVLHDPKAEESLVILFVDTEDDDRRGDETLNAIRPATRRGGASPSSGTTSAFG